MVKVAVDEDKLCWLDLGGGEQGSGRANVAGGADDGEFGHEGMVAGGVGRSNKEFVWLI